MKKQVDDPGGPVSPAARNKNKKQSRVQKNRKRRRSKRGGPKSKAARKTTVRRDAGESLSS
jgi:hypothetical protein